MKIGMISYIAIGAVLAATPAMARNSGGGATSHGMMNTGGGANGGFQQGYSGTAAGTGSMVSKTGFVKERTDEEDHMDGKEVKEGSDEPDEAMPTDEKDDEVADQEKQDEEKADKK